ncbi:MAG TPA: DVUA0089 family protein [Noviherbaspirillum sp.]|nr:DVUA0089 family protein [Noviherbaspirillum sp.]
MTGKKALVAALVAAAVSGTANAETFHFTGNIANHNDVITTTFTLDSAATNVRVWTDSFLSGTNFDPITALWNASTGERLDQNDDNPTINPATQTYFDSGFNIASLDAGTYFFTVATFANFARGNNIADGFAYDNDTPIPLSNWCQPASHCNMGTYWSVWLDGVSSASNPDDSGRVPEPGSMALLGIGLAGLVRARRQKQAA